MTPEQIKKKHGVDSIYGLYVETPKGEITGYVRAATLEDLDMFVSLSMTNGPAAIRALLQALWLEGDESIMTDEVSTQAAMLQLEEIIKTDEVQFKREGADYQFKVTDEEGQEFTCVLKHPTLEDMAIVTQRNPVLSAVRMIEKIWVSGDAICRTDPKKIMAINGMLKMNMEQRTSRLKKF